jgi:hypothetical protein
MDKKIKTAKKHMDDEMKKLLKEDIKRDKKCDHDEKMAKKKSK